MLGPSNSSVLLGESVLRFELEVLGDSFSCYLIMSPLNPFRKINSKEGGTFYDGPMPTPTMAISRTVAP